MRDQAVCLRQWPWSESSQTLWLLTRHHGFVRGLAKGSLRPGGGTAAGAPGGGKYSGGVEPLTRAEVAFIVKPTSELALITEWDLAETFPTLRRDLPAFYAAMYCAEITTLLIHDHDPHPELFDALLVALRQLNGGLIQPALCHYQLALLTHTGYALQAHHDVLTAKALPARAVLHFLPAQGGFTTANDAELAAISPQPDAWPVRGSTVTLLRALVDAHILHDASENIARDPAQPLPMPDAPVDHWFRAGRLLATFLCRLIESPPRTLALVYPDATTPNTGATLPSRRGRTPQ